MSDDKKQVKDVADILFQEKYLTDQDKLMVQNQSTGLRGEGTYQVDGEQFPVKEGAVVRVAPEANVH